MNVCVHVRCACVSVCVQTVHVKGAWQASSKQACMYVNVTNHHTGISLLKIFGSKVKRKLSTSLRARR